MRKNQTKIIRCAITLWAPRHKHTKLQNLIGVQVRSLSHLRIILGAPLPYSAFWYECQCTTEKPVVFVKFYGKDCCIGLHPGIVYLLIPTPHHGNEPYRNIKRGPGNINVQACIEICSSWFQYGRFTSTFFI